MPNLTRQGRSRNRSGDGPISGKTARVGVRWAVVRRGVAIFIVPLLLGALPAVAEAHTLSYSKAKRAAAAKGKRIAHKRTRVKSLIRMSRHRYYAQVHWTRTDPDGCIGCGYDEDTGAFYNTATTEYCFAELTVKFRSRRSRRVVAIRDSQVCF